MVTRPSFLQLKKTRSGIRQIGLGFGFAIGFRFPLSRCTEGIPSTDICYWVWANRVEIEGYVVYQVRVLWFFVGRLVESRSNEY